MKASDAVVEQVKEDSAERNGRDKEVERIEGLLDSLTRTTYSVLGDYKDRRDLEGVLEATDRLTEVVALRIQLYALTRTA